MFTSNRMPICQYYYYSLLLPCLIACCVGMPHSIIGQQQNKRLGGVISSFSHLSLSGGEKRQPEICLLWSHMLDHPRHAKKQLTCRKMHWHDYSSPSSLPFLTKSPPGGALGSIVAGCAAGLSEPLPHYSLFCGQLKGWVEKSPKWLLINYQILLPNCLVSACEKKENLTLHQASLRAFFHAPLQL